MWPFKYPYTNFHELNLDWLLSTVKSNESRISANELKIKLIGGDDPLNSLHPVGSIFMSEDPASPASLFGGTWEQIKDLFLLGAGDVYAAGSQGGEAAHDLTKAELPSHAHRAMSYPQSGTGVNFPLYSGRWGGSVGEGETEGYGALTEEVGGNHPHNNMPPYLAVYIWRRVS